MNKQSGRESSIRGNGLRRLLQWNAHARNALRPGRVSGPLNVVNDAEAYGVAIKPAAVPAGGFYWQAVRVHHLTPEENGGRGHLYLDAFDPSLPGGSSPYGVRVDGARLQVAWENGEQAVTIDKPANEPGACFPIWKWQVCATRALGLPGQELPSDEVTGIHTGHPDEAPGNTLFHHSFIVTFVKVKAPDQVNAGSVIHGIVHRATGRKAVLRKNGATIASQILGASEEFKFATLESGDYTVGIEGTEFRSDPVSVDGRNTIQLDLTLLLSESIISGRVKNGAGRTLRLLRGASEVTTQRVTSDETYRFTGLAEGTYCVAIADSDVVTPEIIINGVNSATADLIAPAPNATLQHYVLFGSASAPATRANMLLAEEYLLTFRPAFGFDPAEAAKAAIITIVGDAKAVPFAVEQQFRTNGSTVQRIGGNIEEIAQTLAARVTSKSPLP